MIVFLPFPLKCYDIKEKEFWQKIFVFTEVF